MSRDISEFASFFGLNGPDSRHLRDKFASTFDEINELRLSGSKIVKDGEEDWVEVSLDEATIDGMAREFCEELSPRFEDSLIQVVEASRPFHQVGTDSQLIQWEQTGDSIVVIRKIFYDGKLSNPIKSEWDTQRFNKEFPGFISRYNSTFPPKQNNEET